MPLTLVVFYQERPGHVPVLVWLRALGRQDARAYWKCLVALERLAQLGHELRRPSADYLRDGIYELRVTCGRVNYRMLYFFHGRSVAILADALTKEGRVPAESIDRAPQRKRRYEQAPDKHTYVEEEADASHE